MGYLKYPFYANKPVITDNGSGGFIDDYLIHALNDGDPLENRGTYRIDIVPEVANPVQLTLLCRDDDTQTELDGVTIYSGVPENISIDEDKPYRLFVKRQTVTPTAYKIKLTRTDKLVTPSNKIH